VHIRLKPIAVRTEPREITEFLQSGERGGTTDFVPLTFPFRWLALPPVRGLIVQALGGPGFLPVHEAQDFTYLRELEVGADYVLAVEARRSAKRARLTVLATVSTPQEVLCARLETVLRIVPLAPGACRELG
jgi:hypothetical protein